MYLGLKNKSICDEYHYGFHFIFCFLFLPWQTHFEFLRRQRAVGRFWHRQTWTWRNTRAQRKPSTTWSWNWSPCRWRSWRPLWSSPCLVFSSRRARPRKSTLNHLAVHRDKLNKGENRHVIGAIDWVLRPVGNGILTPFVLDIRACDKTDLHDRWGGQTIGDSSATVFVGCISLCFFEVDSSACLTWRWCFTSRDEDMQSLASLLSLKQSDIGNLDDFSDEEAGDDRRATFGCGLAHPVTGT